MKKERFPGPYIIWMIVASLMGIPALWYYPNRKGLTMAIVMSTTMFVLRRIFWPKDFR